MGLGGPPGDRGGEPSLEGARQPRGRQRSELSPGTPSPSWEQGRRSGSQSPVPRFSAFPLPSDRKPWERLRAWEEEEEKQFFLRMTVCRPRCPCVIARPRLLPWRWRLLGNQEGHALPGSCKASHKVSLKVSRKTEPAWEAQRTCSASQQTEASSTSTHLCGLLPSAVTG